MRILILGGDGMLGHQLLKRLRHFHAVKVTLRRDLSAYKDIGLFSEGNAYAGLDIRTGDEILGILTDCRPEVVVNCIGIVKQRPAAKESVPSLEVNALFPHRLALMCQAVPARLLQISTDCVFSGRKGYYKEEDIPDAEDLYGRTKFLGELHHPHCLTLRTSIIGHELSHSTGLVEWLLSQKGGHCRGFTRAFFSGLTTAALADVLADVIEKFPSMNGLYHVSSHPISKYELLQLINEIYHLGVTIEKDAEFICDRSLDSTLFRRTTGWKPPGWRDMILRMHQDWSAEE
ncbi:MAG: SDR family oxidoreductase [Nitrospirae bacterium]|nr:MAG: SDR family oxidoreductase [Nitrospirota bacterium]